MLFASSCSKERTYTEYEEIEKQQELVVRSTQSLYAIPDIERPAISLASCVPGVFSIEDNMIKFQNIDEYLKTIEFMNCASATDLENFKSSIPIPTVESEFSEFLGRITEGDTEANIEGYIAEYNGLVKDELNEEGLVSYTTKYETNLSFRNTEGVFMIGNRIMAEYKGTRISILDGDWNKLSVIQNDPEYPDSYGQYIDNPEIIIQRHILITPESCCDQSNNGTHVYDSGDKRIVASYRFTNESIWRENPINSGNWFYIPMVNWKIDVMSQKKGFAGIGWERHRRHWRFRNNSHYLILPNAGGQGLYQSLSVNLGVVGNAWTSHVRSTDGVTYTLGGPRGPVLNPSGGVICAQDIEYTYELYEDLSGPIDEDYTLVCHQNREECDICPDGWIFNSLACYSGICEVGAFVYNGNMWYPAKNGICHQGGTYNAATDHCFLGTVPGFGGLFEWDNCFYAEANCPWD